MKSEPGLARWFARCVGTVAVAFAFAQARSQAADAPSVAAQIRERAERAVKVPAGFRYEILVHRTIREPMDLAVATNGDVWVSTRGGEIWRLDTRTREVVRVGTIPVDVRSGLHGLELDPSFGAEGFFYAFYSPVSTGTARHRVSRFRIRVTAGVPRLDGESEKVYIEFSFEQGQEHQGGAVRFNPADGCLYIGTGDDLATADVVRGLSPDRLWPARLDDFRGKVLRIRPEGSIPDTNPFVGRPGVRPEIYTFGHRQPFTLCFNPVTGGMLAGEIGPDGPEDLEKVQTLSAGSDYGWPPAASGSVRTEGMGAGRGPAPWLSYRRERAACVILGEFYRERSVPGSFPRAFVGGLFYADYSRRWIRFAEVDAGTGELIGARAFAQGFTCYPIALRQGVDGALYVAEYAGYHQISRVVYDPEDAVRR